MHPLFIFPAALHHRASSNQTNNNHNNNNFSDSIYNTKTPTTDLDPSSSSSSFSYRSFASQQTAPTKPPTHTTFRTTTLPLLGFEPASVCYYIAF
jgi:hypothetical protein